MATGARKDLRVGMDLDSSPMVRGLDKVLSKFKGLDDEAKKSFGGAEQSSEKLGQSIEANQPKLAKFKEALGGDFNAEAFQAYEKSVDRAAAKTKREKDLRVKLGADFDRRGFQAYERAIAKVERDQDRQRKQGGNKGVLGVFGGGADRNLTRAGATLGGVGRDGGLLEKLMGFTKWPAIIAGAGAAAAALGALGAGAVALTSALGPLTGALAAGPALFSAYAQAAQTVKLAFLGFKGGEQFTKELEKPTLAGARFSRFLKTLVPDVRRLQVTAQRGLFPGLEKGIAAAAKNLPVFQKMVARTASVMGSLAAEAGKQLGGKDWGKDLNTQGGRNVSTIARLGRAAGNVANVLRHVTIVAGPLVNWLTKMALGWSRSAAGAAQAGRQSGRMAQFFERTRQVMTRLFSISGALATAFYNIGKAAGPVGREILASLDKAAEGFARWTKSTGGQNTLQKYFADAKPAIYEVGRLARDVTKAFFQLGSGKDVAPLIKQLRTEFLPVLTDMVKTASKEFLPALLDLGTEALDLFNKLFGTSGPLTEATKFLAKLVEGVNTLLEKFPQLHSAILVLGTVGGLYNILRIGAAITGVSALIRLLRTARGLAAGTAVAGAAGGVAGGRGGRGPIPVPVGMPPPGKMGRPVPVPSRWGRVTAGASRWGGRALGGLGFAGNVGAGSMLVSSLQKPIQNTFAPIDKALGTDEKNIKRRWSQMWTWMRGANSAGAKRAFAPVAPITTAAVRRAGAAFKRGGWQAAAASLSKSAVAAMQRQLARAHPGVVRAVRRAGQAFRRGGWNSAAGSLATSAVKAITGRTNKVGPEVSRSVRRAGQAFKQGGWKSAATSLANSAVQAITTPVKKLPPEVARNIKRGGEAFRRGDWKKGASTLGNEALKALIPPLKKAPPEVDRNVKKGGEAFKKGNWKKVADELAKGTLLPIKKNMDQVPKQVGPPLDKGKQEIDKQQSSWSTAGGALARKFGEGLVKALEYVKGKMKGALDRLRGMLPSSEPKDPSSPLRRLDKSGEAMMRSLARGITKGRATAVSAARSATRGIAAQLQGGAFAGGRVRMQRDPSGALIPQGSGRGATNLRGLANQLASTSRTATSEVARLLGNIRRQITQGMRRGATGAAMQGLRRAATVVTAEFTQRNKALMARLKEQSAALKRGRTAIERGLRRRGVDIASEDGFKAMQAYSKELVDQLTRQAAALRKQMMAARRAGQSAIAATTRKKLFEVKDQLEETVTQMAEGARRAAAGDFGSYAGQRDSEGGYAEEADDREAKREARREKKEEEKQRKEEARREKQEAKKAEREAKREAQKEHDEVMRENTAELKATREWGERMASAEEGTLRRALADVLSGEIAGAGFRPRAQSAGTGSVARF